MRGPTRRWIVDKTTHKRHRIPQQAPPTSRGRRSACHRPLHIVITCGGFVSTRASETDNEGLVVALEGGGGEEEEGYEGEIQRREGGVFLLSNSLPPSVPTSPRRPYRPLVVQEYACLLAGLLCLLRRYNYYFHPKRTPTLKWKPSSVKCTQRPLCRRPISHPPYWTPGLGSLRPSLAPPFCRPSSVSVVLSARSLEETSVRVDDDDTRRRSSEPWPGSSD